MIKHLDATNDPIIKIFKKDEFLPVTESSLYHLPDMSETNENTSDGKRKIITKDLE